jgi:hypothetical protein
MVVERDTIEMKKGSRLRLSVSTLGVNTDPLVNSSSGTGHQTVCNKVSYLYWWLIMSFSHQMLNAEESSI